MITGPELKHGLFHPLDLVGAREPPFGPIVIGIGAKDGAVALDDPRVDADDGAGGDAGAADRSAGGGHDALVVEAEGGMQAEGFLDAGVEVGQRVRGGEGSDAEGVGWVLWREMGVEFGLQFGVAAGMAEEMVEECC